MSNSRHRNNKDRKKQDSNINYTDNDQPIENVFDARIDKDLHFDRLTREEIYTPVVTNDGAVSDALSVLNILKNGGMSLINSRQRITQAIFVPALQNTLDNYLGENHPDRIAPYDRAKVLEQINERLAKVPQSEGIESDIFKIINVLNQASFLCWLGSGLSWLCLNNLGEIIVGILAYIAGGESALDYMHNLTNLSTSASFNLMLWAAYGFIGTSSVLAATRLHGLFAANNPAPNAAPPANLAPHLEH